MLQVTTSLTTPVPAEDNSTVTPYVVKGDINYDRLLDRLGADRLTSEQKTRFPDPSHPLVRQDVFYVQRDVDPFLDAADNDKPHSIVTGRGPSGPIHIGHIFPFYFAKYLQEQTGTLVYISFSDDEKYFLKNKSMGEISGYIRQNLRDLLAVGFDPDRARITVDTADADVVYPLAAAFAKEVTQPIVDVTYGEPGNIGLSFYPVVRTAHLLLPQLVEGRHPTLAPIAVDQDPHVRVCRDIAAKKWYDVRKSGALLSKFLPSLGGPGKMSSSGDAPSIPLLDDRETVTDKIRMYVFSGGRTNIEEHRSKGGNPKIDVPFQLLYYFFEESDKRIERLAEEYCEGSLLNGELKEFAAERIAGSLEAHQARRSALGSLEEELSAYRLTETEWQAARRQAGYPNNALSQQ